jgi:hypothetical protein
VPNPEPVEPARGWCWRHLLPPHVGTCPLPAIGVECVDVCGLRWCLPCARAAGLIPEAKEAA